jgi:pimeloyl-ACP methyl ester carboxylesterase
MNPLDECYRDGEGAIRWTRVGTGPPIVLVHGTPYSSRIFSGVVPALAEHREVFLFDHLGYGQSERREGQDLSIAAQGRRFARLLQHWRLDAPSVVATDIGGAIALRALLLEDAAFADLLLFDAVTGGDWERGLFALMLKHTEVFEALPDYAHRALVAAHMRTATQLVFVLDCWRSCLHLGSALTGRPPTTGSTASCRRLIRPSTNICSARSQSRFGSCGAATTESSRRNMPSGSPHVFRMLR